MSASTTRRLVMRTAAALVAAAAGLASPVLAQNWHWVAANGNWSTGGNWNPAVAPNVGSIVNIGNTGPAANASVSISGSVQMAALNITDGMSLRNEGWSVWVAGTTFISGSNIAAGPLGLQTVYPSRVILEGVDGNSLVTQNLTISDEGRLDCLSSATVTVNDLATTSTLGRIGGYANFSLLGAGPTINNNGLIVPNGGNGITFVNLNNAGLFNLDGTEGTGVLDLSTNSSARIRFVGNGLTDSFGGVIKFTSGAELDMDLANPWVADSLSRIDVETTPPSTLPMIRGSALTFGGVLNTSGTGGSFMFNSDALTIDSPARFNIAANNNVITSQTTPAVVNGGTFNIASSGNQSGNVTFNGAVTFNAGQFNMTVPDAGTAQLNLYGATTWSGTVNITGNAAQYGDATVADPTVINARRMVMRPGTGTLWTIQSGLTINAHGIGWNSNNTSADVNIGGGLLPRLTINLDDPQEHWSSYGDINLTGAGGIFITRIAGSPMYSYGNITLPSGRAQIDADTRFYSDTVNLTAANAELRMMRNTLVGGNVDFTGQGVFRNGPTGHMTLETNTELGLIGLYNEGVLEIGNPSVGTISADRFTAAAGSTWAVDIGGPLAGSQFDLMLISGGGVALAGQIEVRLINLGGPSFTPAVGDQFTILTSLGNVTGTFTNGNPVTEFAGSTYHWTVLYGAHTVVLRLDSITPATCNDADVAGLGGTVGPDGALTADDVVLFLSSFFANNMAIADVAGLGGGPGADGAITPDDLVYFLAMFFSPCGH